MMKTILVCSGCMKPEEECTCTAVEFEVCDKCKTHQSVDGYCLGCGERVENCTCGTKEGDFVTCSKCKGKAIMKDGEAICVKCDKPVSECTCDLSEVEVYTAPERNVLVLCKNCNRRLITLEIEEAKQAEEAEQNEEDSSLCEAKSDNEAIEASKN